MPKAISLHNQSIGVEHGTELDQQKSQELGSPVTRPIWTLVFADRVYKDEIRISFGREARDVLVRDLTGGIVLAGGELPQKPVPGDI